MTNAKKPNRASATTAEQKRLRRCVLRAVALIAKESSSCANAIEPTLDVALIDQLEFRSTPPKQEAVPEGDPSPAEISIMLTEIQSTWTTTIEAKRRYNADEDRQYDIPIVKSMGFDFKDEIW